MRKFSFYLKIIALVCILAYFGMYGYEWAVDVHQTAIIASYPQDNGEVKALVTLEPDKTLPDVDGVTVRKEYADQSTVAIDATPSAAKELLNSPDVEVIEPDTVVTIQAQPMWGFNKIEAGLVHSLKHTGAGCKVAVIDTGIDMNHPALQQVYAGGYDFVNADNKPFDDNFHGTHCAGIIAAQVTNNAPMFGVAPGVKLYALKVLDKDGVGHYSNIISAIQWCVNNKINIISMSFGAERYSVAFKRACERAKEAGITLIAAAGNNGGGIDTLNYPAKFGSVISVGAIDPDGKWADYSSTGKDLDVAAPGTDILSTCPNKNYFELSGTSMAAPYVTGVAALLYTSGVKEPTQIQEKLQYTAIDAGKEGVDSYFGYGITNAYAAVVGMVKFDVAAVSIDFGDVYIRQSQKASYTLEFCNFYNESLPVTIQVKDLSYNVTLLYGVFTIPPQSTIEQTYTRAFSKAGEHKLELRVMQLKNEVDITNNICYTNIYVNRE